MAIKKPSPKKAIADYCKSCIYDPLHFGGVRQQIATCTTNSCALYAVRPVDKKTTKLTRSLLNKYQMSEDDLDDRARELLHE